MLSKKQYVGLANSVFPLYINYASRYRHIAISSDIIKINVYNNASSISFFSSAFFCLNVFKTPISCQSTSAGSNIKNSNGTDKKDNPVASSASKSSKLATDSTTSTTPTKPSAAGAPTAPAKPAAAHAEHHHEQKVLNKLPLGPKYTPYFNFGGVKGISKGRTISKFCYTDNEDHTPYIKACCVVFTIFLYFVYYYPTGF